MAEEHRNTSRDPIPDDESGSHNLAGRSNARLAAVEAVGDSIARATDMSGLFEDLLGVLITLLASDVAAVFMRAESSKEAILWHQVTGSGEEMPPRWWNRLPGRVMEGSKPMTFVGASALVPAVAGVALRSRDQVTGALLIARRMPQEYHQEDVGVLSVVGAQLGMALENVRLEERSSRQLREQDVLFDVNRAIAATLDLDGLLNLIVHSALTTIPATDACVMHLLDQETGALLPRAASFIPRILPRASGKSDMRKGRGIAGEAMATGKIINVQDVTRDARFTEGTGRSFRALMVAPLMIGDQCIGTLSIDSQVPAVFSPDDEKLLSLLASQAAVAIRNAQLFSEAQRLSGDLQQSLEDLQQAQALLIQSEKLSALGELIAGVAHELNNPLTAVMGYAQLLQGTEGVSERMERDLRKIRLQAQRAARIVQSLLTFARQHRVEQKRVEVNRVIAQVLELREYQLRVNNIRLVTDLAEEPLEVLADANQLQQVFLNLINNSQDAISDHADSGQLTITSRLARNVVRLEFADDGPGISPENMGKLFSPFFTTKGVGKGTGLGLSICYGIVRQHGGRIWAETEQGQGATFIIELPVSPREAGSLAEMVAQQETEVLVTGRLLAVDDDEEVAELLHRLLTDDGHEVNAALSGEAALKMIEVAEEAGRPYDLIICDIKMPGMSGPHLFREIRIRYPNLAERMIFFTGDTMNLDTRTFLEGIPNPHVSKPFVVRELREVIGEMLEEHVLRGDADT